MKRNGSESSGGVGCPTFTMDVATSVMKEEPQHLKGGCEVTNARRAGITHFSLSEEQGSQKQVPPRGKRKKASGPATSVGTTRGQRTSRRTGRDMPAEGGNTFTAKGSKGGKTGGSRAGLTSSRKASKDKRN